MDLKKPTKQNRNLFEYFSESVVVLSLSLVLSALLFVLHFFSNKRMEQWKKPLTLIIC